MPAQDWVTEQFEQNRGRLRGVAFRMLGSLSEADDAVQEAWLRLSRSDAGGIENMGGWLTTVVSVPELGVTTLPSVTAVRPIRPSIGE